MPLVAGPVADCEDAMAISLNRHFYQLQLQHENYEKEIKKLKEEIKSHLDQLEFQHKNYENRILELHNELKDQIAFKNTYRELYKDNYRDYYCLKNSNGDMYKYLFNVTAIFATVEEANFVAKHITDPGYRVDIYTGK